VHVQSIALLVIVILGGTAVVAAMCWLRAKAAGSDALWGGSRPACDPCNTVSMLVSVAGYFAVLYYVFVRLDPPEVLIGVGPASPSCSPSSFSYSSRRLCGCP